MTEFNQDLETPSEKPEQTPSSEAPQEQGAPASEVQPAAPTWLKFGALEQEAQDRRGSLQRHLDFNVYYSPEARGEPVAEWMRLRALGGPGDSEWSPPPEYGGRPVRTIDPGKDLRKILQRTSPFFQAGTEHRPQQILKAIHHPIDTIRQFFMWEAGKLGYGPPADLPEAFDWSPHDPTEVVIPRYPGQTETEAIQEFRNVMRSADNAALGYTLATFGDMALGGVPSGAAAVGDKLPEIPAWLTAQSGLLNSIQQSKSLSMLTRSLAGDVQANPYLLEEANLSAEAGALLLFKHLPVGKAFEFVSTRAGNFLHRKLLERGNRLLSRTGEELPKRGPEIVGARTTGPGLSGELLKVEEALQTSSFDLYSALWNKGVRRLPPEVFVPAERSLARLREVGGTLSASGERITITIPQGISDAYVKDLAAQLRVLKGFVVENTGAELRFIIQRGSALTASLGGEAAGFGSLIGVATAGAALQDPAMAVRSIPEQIESAAAIMVGGRALSHYRTGGFKERYRYLGQQGDLVHPYAPPGPRQTTPSLSQRRTHLDDIPLPGLELEGRGAVEELSRVYRGVGSLEVMTNIQKTMQALRAQQVAAIDLLVKEGTPLEQLPEVLRPQNDILLVRMNALADLAARPEIKEASRILGTDVESVLYSPVTLEYEPQVFNLARYATKIAKEGRGVETILDEAPPLASPDDVASMQARTLKAAENVLAARPQAAVGLPEGLRNKAVRPSEPLLLAQPGELEPLEVVGPFSSLGDFDFPDLNALQRTPEQSIPEMQALLSRAFSNHPAGHLGRITSRNPDALGSMDPLSAELFFQDGLVRAIVRNKDGVPDAIDITTSALPARLREIGNYKEEIAPDSPVVWGVSKDGRFYVDAEASRNTLRVQNRDIWRSRVRHRRGDKISALEESPGRLLNDAASLRSNERLAADALLERADALEGKLLQADLPTLDRLMLKDAPEGVRNREHAENLRVFADEWLKIELSRAMALAAKTPAPKFEDSRFMGVSLKDLPDYLPSGKSKPPEKLANKPQEVFNESIIEYDGQGRPLFVQVFGGTPTRRTVRALRRLVEDHHWAEVPTPEGYSVFVNSRIMPKTDVMQVPEGFVDLTGKAVAHGAKPGGKPPQDKSAEVLDEVIARANAIDYLQQGGHFSKNPKLFTALSDKQKFMIMQMRIADDRIPIGGGRNLEYLNPRRWQRTGKYPKYFGKWRPTTEQMDVLTKLWQNRAKQVQKTGRVLDVMAQVAQFRKELARGRVKGDKKTKAIEKKLEEEGLIDVRDLYNVDESMLEEIRLSDPDIYNEFLIQFNKEHDILTITSGDQAKGVEALKRITGAFDAVLAEASKKGEQLAPTPKEVEITRKKWLGHVGTSLGVLRTKWLQTLGRPEYVLGEYRQGGADPVMIKALHESGELDRNPLRNLDDGLRESQDLQYNLDAEWEPLRRALAYNMKMDKKTGRWEGVGAEINSFLSMALMQGYQYRLPKNKVWNLKATPFTKPMKVDAAEIIPKLREQFDFLHDRAAKVMVEENRQALAQARQEMDAIRWEINDRIAERRSELEELGETASDGEIYQHLLKNDRGASRGKSPLSAFSFKDLQAQMEGRLKARREKIKEIEEIGRGKYYRESYYPMLYNRILKEGRGLVAAKIDPVLNEIYRKHPEITTRFLRTRLGSKQQPIADWLAIDQIYTRSLVRYITLRPAVNRALRLASHPDYPVLQREYLRELANKVVGNYPTEDILFDNAVNKGVMKEPSFRKWAIKATTGVDVDAVMDKYPFLFEKPGTSEIVGRQLLAPTYMFGIDPFKLTPANIFEMLYAIPDLAQHPTHLMAGTVSYPWAIAKGISGRSAEGLARWKNLVSARGDIIKTRATRYRVNDLTHEAVTMYGKLSEQAREGGSISAANALDKWFGMTGVKASEQLARTVQFNVLDWNARRLTGLDPDLAGKWASRIVGHTQSNFSVVGWSPRLQNLMGSYLMIFLRYPGSKLGRMLSHGRMTMEDLPLIRRATSPRLMSSRSARLKGREQMRELGTIEEPISVPKETFKFGEPERIIIPKPNTEQLTYPKWNEKKKALEEKEVPFYEGELDSYRKELLEDPAPHGVMFAPYKGAWIRSMLYIAGFTGLTTVIFDGLFRLLYAALGKPVQYAWDYADALYIEDGQTFIQGVLGDVSELWHSGVPSARYVVAGGEPPTPGQRKRALRASRRLIQLAIAARFPRLAGPFGVATRMEAQKERKAKERARLRPSAPRPPRPLGGRQ